MIALDTSSFVAYLNGEEGQDVTAVDEALALNQVVLPPAVLTEMLSTPRLDRRVVSLMRELPVLDADSGYWERVALTRRKILQKRLRARLADALIAQSCLDHQTPLITRDSDFRHFVRHAGLKLL